MVSLERVRFEATQRVKAPGVETVCTDFECTTDSRIVEIMKREVIAIEVADEDFVNLVISLYLDELSILNSSSYLRRTV